MSANFEAPYQEMSPVETQDVQMAGNILGSLTGQTSESLSSIMDPGRQFPENNGLIPPNHDCTKCVIDAASCTLITIAQANGGDNPIMRRMRAVEMLTRENPSFINEANPEILIKSKMNELTTSPVDQAQEFPIQSQEIPQVESFNNTEPKTSEPQQEIIQTQEPPVQTEPVKKPSVQIEQTRQVPAQKIEKADIQPAEKMQPAERPIPKLEVHQKSASSNEHSQKVSTTPTSTEKVTTISIVPEIKPKEQQAEPISLQMAPSEPQERRPEPVTKKPEAKKEQKRLKTEKKEPVSKPKQEAKSVQKVETRKPAITERKKPEKQKIDTIKQEQPKENTTPKIENVRISPVRKEPTITYEEQSPTLEHAEQIFVRPIMEKSETIDKVQSPSNENAELYNQDMLAEQIIQELPQDEVETNIMESDIPVSAELLQESEEIFVQENTDTSEERIQEAPQDGQESFIDDPYQIEGFTISDNSQAEDPTELAQADIPVDHIEAPIDLKEVIYEEILNEQTSINIFSYDTEDAAASMEVIQQPDVEPDSTQELRVVSEYVAEAAAPDLVEANFEPIFVPDDRKEESVVIESKQEESDLQMQPKDPTPETPLPESTAKETLEIKEIELSFLLEIAKELLALLKSINTPEDDAVELPQILKKKLEIADEELKNDTFGKYDEYFVLINWYAILLHKIFAQFEFEPVIKAKSDTPPV